MSRYLGVVVILFAGVAYADELPTTTEKEREFKKSVDQAITRGLDWIVANQNRDGHWESTGGQYQ